MFFTEQAVYPSYLLIPPKNLSLCENSSVHSEAAEELC